MRKYLEHKWIQNLISILLVAGTLISIFKPELHFFERGSDFTVHYMVALLGLSMLFLAYNNSRLMFTSLACCAALCIFLKRASNAHLILPEVNLEPHVTIAHINLSNLESGYEQLNNILLTYAPDVLSLQEVTPDWQPYIENQLQHQFPYQHNNVRMDPYGMAVMSKIEISKSDTFQYQEIPNLVNVIKVGQKAMKVVSSYVLPPLNSKSGKKTKRHLKRIANKIEKLGESVISIGDFNMVYWSNDIMDYRDETKLHNSRRDFNPVGFRKPYDHIFYSDDLECTKFIEINDKKSNHVGIIGTYQFKSSVNPSDIKAALGYVE